MNKFMEWFNELSEKQRGFLLFSVSVVVLGCILSIKWTLIVIGSIGVLVAFMLMTMGSSSM